MQSHFIYIDPGSGSYLIQVIVAAIVGAAFWIKMSWYRIKSFFTGHKMKPPKEEEKEKQVNPH